MDMARKFWPRLSVVGILINAVLFLAFYFAFRSANQTEGMNRWVNHTQEVLGVIARARLERAWLQTGAWAYLSTHGPELPLRFQSDLKGLRADLERMQVLTTDNPAQQEILRQLVREILAQAGSLEEVMKQAAPASETGGTRELPTAAFSSEYLRELFDSLEANERALFARRSAAVRASARQTRLVLIFAGVLSLAILGAGTYVIWREIKMRSEVEAGLNRAQELLGGKYEEGRAELGQTLKNLHAQISARQAAEGEIRRLNENLEEQVKQRTAELEEANKHLEAFSYSVSHDLRAPLRHMDGFSRILQQEYGQQLPEEARHYLDRIRSAAKQMADLVEDLLALSRIDRQLPQPQRIFLASLVQEALAEVLPEAGSREIQWQIHPLPEAEVDAILFRQVLVNLFSNAIKFTRNQARPLIEIGSVEKNGETVVFVRDNGAGFDLRYADKLFGVFQRLHRQDEFEGTGIGLATVQRIIHKHGCRVWAESQPEQGATFYFTVPACSPSKVMIGAPA
jgi:signal transduction histidine kinase